MKNVSKVILSAVAIALYLLIAMATSLDDSGTFFTEGNVVNISDSCRVARLRLVFNVSPTNADTVNAFPSILEPGDTAYVFIDSLPYHTLLYDCLCSDALPDRSVPFVQGPTTIFPTIEVGCE